MTLRLDWCSHAAAKYAVEHWHYSRTMPMPPLVKIGVWEDGRFVGCVLFSRGANMHIGTPYGLDTTDVAELTRVALTKHETPTSKVVAVAIRLLRSSNPGLRLIVSYADANEGHVGTIYQAGGWVYTGCIESSPKFRTPQGAILKQRQVSKTGLLPQFGKVTKVPLQQECVVIPQLPKHKYLMPLDPAMRAQIEPLRKPYPKRATSIVADAPVVQTGEDGATPIVALQSLEAVHG